MAINKRIIRSNDEAAAGGASFNTVLYTGSGSDGLAVTGAGFSPDFVWIKPRTQADNHNIYDTLRGVRQQLIPNNTSAESTQPRTLQSFDADGFTLNDDNNVNNSGIDYVAWCWKAGGSVTPNNNTDGTITSTVSANPDAGFSIVKYTGTLTSAGNISVGHGLSNPPELIISKRIDSTGNWRIRPFFLNNNPYDYLEFDTDALAQLNSSDGTMSLPTSTTFDNNWNTALGGAGEVIAYCFHSVDGYQKVGSYTGDGTSSNLVVTGFQPKFVMFKKSSSTGNWYISDNLRRNGDNVLRPNTSESEFDGGADRVDFESNGFRLKNGDGEQNGLNQTYIYLAIA